MEVESHALAAAPAQSSEHAGGYDDGLYDLALRLCEVGDIPQSEIARLMDTLVEAAWAIDLRMQSLENHAHQRLEIAKIRKLTADAKRLKEALAAVNNVEFLSRAQRQFEALVPAAAIAATRTVGSFSLASIERNLTLKDTIDKIDRALSRAASATRLNRGVLGSTGHLIEAGKVLHRYWTQELGRTFRTDSWTTDPDNEDDANQDQLCPATPETRFFLTALTGITGESLSGNSCRHVMREVAGAVRVHKR